MNENQNTTLNGKIDVIIPVYNAQEYINESVQSALACESTNVIIVDDGSTDHSLAICIEMQKRYPDRIRVFHQTNQKQGAARNVGVQNSNAEYIVFLDADDRLNTDFAKICIGEMSQYDLDILLFNGESFCDQSFVGYTDQLKYDRNIRTHQLFCSRQQINKECGLDGIVQPGMMMVRRQFLVEQHIKFMENVFYEDNAYMIDLFLCAMRVKFIPNRFYYRRYRAGSVMTHTRTCSDLMDYWKVSGYSIHKLNMFHGDSTFTSIRNHKIAGFLGNLLTMLVEISNVEISVSVEILRFVYHQLINIMNSGMILINDVWKIDRLIHSLTDEIKDNELFHSGFDLNELGKMKELIDKGETDYFRHLVSMIPLEQSNCTIAFYGTGVYTKDLFQYVAQMNINILATVIFYTSKKQNIEFYGREVFCIEELECGQVDTIYISSPAYHNKMKETVQSLMVGQKVVDLVEQMPECKL